jgi:serine/threonine protein kinase
LAPGGWARSTAPRTPGSDARSRSRSSPASVAADPERLARFDREARLLAALTHPRIATLHALEQIERRPVLVMELVSGEDLSQRIDRGPVPIPDDVRCAVHRPLTPVTVADIFPQP